MSPARGDNVVRLEPAAAALRDEFVGWQCRIRQLAVREDGGRPSSGMRPAVLTPAGEALAHGIVVLLLPADPEPATKLFRYQVLKTQDPVERYDKALEILAGSHYQRPREFDDVMTGLFGNDSAVAGRLLSHGACILAFSQYAQSYRLPCAVAALGEHDPRYQATYWHNRLFNARMPAGVRVLAFRPDWAHASSSREE
ncbi:MAG: hypothetical protein U1E53_09620 [Dongiaceae bacterium]